MNTSTKKQELFLQLEYKLLQDKRLSLSQVLIISYLKSYQHQKNDQYFYDTQENLSKILNIKLRTLKSDIKYLLELGIIFFKTKSAIDGKRQYKNRKAIIFVYAKNPLPKKEEAVPASEKSIQLEVKEIPTSDIDSLIEFSNNYNKSYDGAKGRYYIVNMMIKDGKVNTQEEVINHYNQ